MNGGEQERDSWVYLSPNGFLHLPLVLVILKIHSKDLSF